MKQQSIRYAEIVTSSEFHEAARKLEDEFCLTYTVCRNDQYGSDKLICPDLPANACWPYEFSNCFSPSWWNADGSGQVRRGVPGERIAESIGIDLDEFRTCRQAFHTEKDAIHAKTLQREVAEREAALSAIAKAGFKRKRKSWRKDGVFISESWLPSGWFRVKNTATNAAVRKLRGYELAAFLGQ